MKSVLIAAAMMLSATAMAEGAEHQAAPATTPAPAAAAKVSKKEARKECLKENKELKGAKLAECVKSKTN